MSFPPNQIDDYRRRAQQNILGRILNQPRQPWDERTPSGQSVQDLLRSQGADALPRIRPQQPMSDITAAPQQPAQPSPRIAISSQPAKGIVGALNLPEPTDPTNIRPAGDAALTLPTPAPSTPTVGPSIRGMGKLDRDITLREALQTADPESKVRVAGDQIDIGPPAMKGATPRRSRWATAGEAAVNALGSADPDRPLYSLGQGLGAGITGIVSPRAGAKLNRRFDIQRLDNDIARGIQMEQMQGATRPQGQISTRVVTEGEYPGIEAGTEVRTRVNPRTGEVEDVRGPGGRPVIADLAKRPSAGAPHYEKDAEGYLITVQGGHAQRVLDDNGKPVQVKATNADGEAVEVVVNGRTLRVTPGQALGYYGQIGAREQQQEGADLEADYKWQVENAENAGKRSAALQAATDLIATAEDHQRKVTTIAGRISALDAQMSKMSSRDPALEPLKRQREQLKEAQANEQKAMDAAYSAANEKKAEANKYPDLPRPPKRAAGTSAAPPPPPGVTEASVRAEAKRRGQDEEAAVARAKQFGWIK